MYVLHYMVVMRRSYLAMFNETDWHDVSIATSRRMKPCGEAFVGDTLTSGDKKVYEMLVPYQSFQ